MIVYQYKRGDDGTSRPVADIVLATGNQKVEVSFYIDSGADITLIPLQFGKALGFKQARNEIKEIHGVSGAGVPFIEKKVKMRFGKRWYPVTVAWALIEEVPPLLGRRDVFSNFRITFDEAQARIEFVEGHAIVVEPRHDFWALSGALKSKVKLTDAQLKQARLG